MPDCHWLLKFGYCSAGDECLYYHPHAKRRVCEDYARGFCYYGASAAVSLCTRAERSAADSRDGPSLPTHPFPVDAGPACPRRHIPNTLCPLYAAGFCPAGPSCAQGHPKPRPPLPEAYRPASPPSETPPGPPPPGYGRWAEWDPKGVQQVRHGGGGGGGGGPGGPGGGQAGRDQSGVLCFKCGQKGHFANLCVSRARPLLPSSARPRALNPTDPRCTPSDAASCPNRNVPGNRGGLDRTGVPINK